MPTRKGGTKDNKSHHKSKGNVSQDYDINYYGDDKFLKISSYEKEKNFVEARISELERRNNALERRNKALVVSVIILLIVSFGTLITTILNKVKIEQQGVQSQNQSEIQVIQRRGDFGNPRENFTRNWADYKLGFGDPNREFWLGNDRIHQLTTLGDMKLRIELEAHNGTKRWAEVENEDQGYRLHIGGYSGNAGDSLAAIGSSNSNLNGMKFTTYDRDNDNYTTSNCALSWKGGWWFNRCFSAHLNGEYFTDPETLNFGIIWEDWLGFSYSLKSSIMILKRQEFIV